jgi:hypothetical protein
VPDGTKVLKLPTIFLIFMEIILYFSSHNGVGFLQYVFPYPIYPMYSLSIADESLFLSEFAKLRNANISCVMPVCPNGTIWLPLDGFS